MCIVKEKERDELSKYTENKTKHRDGEEIKG